MTTRKLRQRAAEEAIHLGPEPPDPRDRIRWREERRGAVVCLAEFADDDVALLRRASLQLAGELVDCGARDLLLDAAMRAS